MPQIKLSNTTLDYRDEGSGPPAMLIHGLLVNGRVWDPLLPGLAPNCRCLIPDLPLGAHRLPAGNAADLTPPGLADLIAEFIERLELGEVTLIGSDTGGALCQLVAAKRSELIARLVLMNCDSFEHFPPPAFKPTMNFLARVPGALVLMGDAMRLGLARKVGYAPLTATPLEDELLKEWARPLRKHAIRRDLLRVLRAIAPEHTLRAAERLEHFDRPVLLVWGTRDKFFPVEHGERLAELFPAARLEKVESARTFVQVDAPARVAELVREFVHGPLVEAYQEV
jgi:pimeloyl-ACP methyl ester carboxylesterase